MKKKIEYKVLYNMTLFYLELEVEKYLRDGWDHYKNKKEVKYDWGN